MCVHDYLANIYAYVFISFFRKILNGRGAARPMFYYAIFFEGAYTYSRTHTVFVRVRNCVDNLTVYLKENKKDRRALVNEEAISRNYRQERDKINVNSGPFHLHSKSPDIRSFL